MSNEMNTVTGVVERMLDHAAHGRWDALPEVLGEQHGCASYDARAR